MYYNLLVDDEHKKAKIDIYGDITSYPWVDSDVDAYSLSKELEQLADMNEIEIHINSYGGEVAEGLAIYNSLKNHKAKITTITDGFACSIASVIFMAGDERIMNNASLLMIHNAWTFASGNANDMKKAAEDLEKITQASVEAYKSVATISEDEIKELMDNESWISSAEAMQYGFATQIMSDKATQPSQSVKQMMMQRLREKEKVGHLETPPAVPKKKSFISLFNREVK